MKNLRNIIKNNLLKESDTTIVSKIEDKISDWSFNGVSNDIFFGTTPTKVFEKTIELYVNGLNRNQILDKLNNYDVKGSESYFEGEIIASLTDGDVKNITEKRLRTVKNFWETGEVNFFYNNDNTVNLSEQALKLYGSTLQGGTYSAKEFARKINEPTIKEAVEKLEGIKQVVKQDDTVYWSDIKYTLSESLKLMQCKQMNEGI